MTGAAARLFSIACLLLQAATATADYREAGGSVRLEAENYHFFVSQGGHTWQTSCSAGIAGFLRDGAVVALPEDTVRNDFGDPPDPARNPLTNSPRLDYMVNFANTGLYYVWVRGWGPGPLGPDGDSNSIHIGIDYDLANGTGTRQLSRVTFYNSPTPLYRWSLVRVEPDLDPTEPPKPVQIATPGDHVVSIWMRESGTYVDQILLTSTDPGFNAATGTYAFDPGAGQLLDSVDPAATGGSLPLAATPTISPNGGTVLPPASVAFDTCTGKTIPSAPLIYYTTDGSTPTASTSTPVSPGTTVPALVSANLTVKAITTATSYWESEAASATFMVDSAATGFAATFNTGSDGFSYSDDLFRSTGQPAYASGVLDPSGGYTQGGLRVNVGGIDDATVSGMSGGWSHAFSMPVAGQATVRLRYRLRIEGTFEQEECGQALLAVDGVLRGAVGGQDYLAQFCGTTPQSGVAKDTGWQQATLQVALAAGTHWLRVGGYNNQKTRANEFMTVYFDDVEVVVPSAQSPQLALTPSSLSFSLASGKSGSQSLQLTSSDGSAATYSATDNSSGWLTVTPATGSTPAALLVSASASGLVAGSYSALITVSSAGYTGVSIPVTLTVSQPTTIPVPAVVGLTQAAAESAIVAAGLAVGTISTQSSSSVPAGSVISQSPSSGTQVAVGSSVALTVSSGPAIVTLLSANFDSSGDGFSYADDGFRGTKQPKYASGLLDAAGGFNRGGVRVNVGGFDNRSVTGMSGGWYRSFATSVAGNVTVRLRYRLSIAGTYEQEECGQALLAIDGVLRGAGGAPDYLAQLCGRTPQSGVAGDTGWQQVTLTVSLSAGTHLLRIGGYNNQKNQADESTTVYFDDLEVVTN